MVEKEDVFKCCVHFWRILFVILNSMFFIIGLCLIGLSIYLLASQNDLTFLTGNRIASGGVLILIAGIVTSAISLIGVVGAIGMWPALLIVYLVLLFFIVVLEVVAGVLGFVYRNQLESYSGERAVDAISRYRSSDADDFRSDVNTIIDFLQSEFACCGYSGVDDWLNTEYYVNNTNNRFPSSCNCTENIMNMASMDDCLETSNGQLIYSASCNNSVSAFLESNLIIVGGVGIAFGLFEIIGIAMAIALTSCFCVIRNNKDDYEFTKAV